MPFAVQRGLGRGNTYFVMLLLKVTSHMTLHSEQTALCRHAWGVRILTRVVQNLQPWDVQAIPSCSCFALAAETAQATRKKRADFNEQTEAITFSPRYQCSAGLHRYASVSLTFSHRASVRPAGQESPRQTTGQQKWLGCSYQCSHCPQQEIVHCKKLLNLERIKNNCVCNNRSTKCPVHPLPFFSPGNVTKSGIGRYLVPDGSDVNGTASGNKSNVFFFFLTLVSPQPNSTVWTWVSSVVQQDLWVTADIVAVQRLSSSPWTCQRKQSTIIFVVCAQDDHSLQSAVALVEDPDLLPVQFGPPKVEPTCVAATYAVALCSFFASVTLPLHTSLL